MWYRKVIAGLPGIQGDKTDKTNNLDKEMIGLNVPAEQLYPRCFFAHDLVMTHIL